MKFSMIQKANYKALLFLLLFLIPLKMSAKKDQLSEVFRYVKMDYHDDEIPSELKVVEAFTSFIEVEHSPAIGLHKLITNSIQQKGLDIKNCRGQRYDGAAVMSGKYSGLHKKIQNVAPHIYYVRALWFAQFKFGVKRCHGIRD